MKGASVGEVMKELGDTWGAMTEEQQAPFVELAKEEATEYEKQRVLLEKAQKPTELWQPMRRCLMVVDRLSNDSFAEIFLEPVDIDDFPDYLEYVDTPMDLGTVRTKIKNKKYMGPEQFARDMRKVRLICHHFITLPFLLPIIAYMAFMIFFRFGAIAKFTINMAVRFGMLQITCQNNLNVSTMLG